MFPQDNNERQMGFETSFYQFENGSHRSNLSDLEKNNVDIFDEISSYQSIIRQWGLMLMVRLH